MCGEGGCFDVILEKDRPCSLASSQINVSLNIQDEWNQNNNKTTQKLSLLSFLCIVIFRWWWYEACVNPRMLFFLCCLFVVHVFRGCSACTHNTKKHKCMRNLCLCICKWIYANKREKKWSTTQNTTHTHLKWFVGRRLYNFSLVEHPHTHTHRQNLIMIIFIYIFFSQWLK